MACHQCEVKVGHLSKKGIMFGIPKIEAELLVNHILLAAKQYLYFCWKNRLLPSIQVLR